MFKSLMIALLFFAHEDKPNLVLEKAEPKLTDKQKAIVKRTSEAKHVVCFEVVAFDIEAIKDSVTFDLPQEKRLIVKNYDKRKGEQKSLILMWEDKKDSFTITVNTEKEIISGLIYYNSKVFYIEPLGKGLAIVSQVDQSKIKDHDK